MKSGPAVRVYLLGRVAPFAGAWIEIGHTTRRGTRTAVAPFAGAWIEICVLPLCVTSWYVAPFAGAWIEISEGLAELDTVPGRTLRGCVD